MSKNRHTMPVAAHLLLRDSSGRVLFMRRANTGYGDGQWSVPAGHAEPGETLHASCVREAEEEIGVTLAVGDVTALLMQHKRDDDGEERLDAFFLADLPPGQSAKIAEPDLCDGIDWRPLADPPRPLLSYLAAALRTINTRPGDVLSYYGFDEPSGRSGP